ncbi:hypothetical protein ACHAWF_010085 [Thalassiosira exigua]
MRREARRSLEAERERRRRKEEAAAMREAARRAQEASSGSVSLGGGAVAASGASAGAYAGKNAVPLLSAGGASSAPGSGGRDATTKGASFASGAGVAVCKQGKYARALGGANDGGDGRVGKGGARGSVPAAAAAGEQRPSPPLSAAAASDEPATSATYRAAAEQEWTKRLASWKRYARKHGRSDVSCGHTLSDWIRTQRNVCRRWLRASRGHAHYPSHDPGALTEEHLRQHVKVRRLQEAGFDWGRAADEYEVRRALSGERKSLSPERREELGIADDATADVDLAGRATRRKGARMRRSDRNGSVFDVVRRKRRLAEEEDEESEEDSSSDEEMEFGSDDGESDGAESHPWRHAACFREKEKKESHDAEEDGSSDADVRETTSRSDEYEDERPGVLSWHGSPGSRKRPREDEEEGDFLDALSSPSRCVALALLMDRVGRRASEESSAERAPTEVEGQSWYDLERAPPGEAGGAKPRPTAPDADGEPLSPPTEASAKRRDVDASAAEGEASAAPLEAGGRSRASSGGGAVEGDSVYAAFWSRRGPRAGRRAGAPCFYPGTVMRRVVRPLLKTMESEGSEEDGSAEGGASYDVRFDDGDVISDLSSRHVIPRETYLERNLKPRLEEGEEVYALWRARGRSRSCGWYPGKVTGRRELGHGGPYGPIRFYDVRFDDGDERSNVQDHLVMNKRDYLLSVRRNVESYDGDGSDDDGGGGGEKKWIGVKNKVDRNAFRDDDWARKVGWYVTTVDGEERSFSLLSDALLAYDADAVRRHGAGTRRSDLNLPNEWSFADPKRRARPPVLRVGGASSGVGVGRGSDPNAADGRGMKRSRREPQDEEAAAGAAPGGGDERRIEQHALTNQTIAVEVSAKGDGDSGVGSNGFDPPAGDDGGSSDEESRFSDVSLPNATERAEAAKGANEADRTLREDDLSTAGNDADVATAPTRASKKRCDDATGDDPILGPLGSDPQNDIAKGKAVSKSLGSMSDALDGIEGGTDLVSRASGREKMSESKEPPTAALGCTRSTTNAARELIDLTEDAPVLPKESASNVPNDVPIPTAGLATKASKSSAARGKLTRCAEQAQYTALPSEEFPGWTVKKIPYKTKHRKSMVTWHFSPQKGYSFTSKPEVRRFLECLKDEGGNEALAMNALRAKKKPSNNLKETDQGKPPLATNDNHTASMSSAANYVTSSSSTDEKDAVATAALSHSRSTTKAILDLIDLPKEPEIALKSPVETLSKKPESTLKSPVETSTSCSSEIVPKPMATSDGKSPAPGMTSEDFPNWTVRRVPRPSGHIDTYWFSPQKGYKFRSKKEVGRFLECLRRSNGDEELAMEEFRGRKKGRKHTQKASTAPSSMHYKMVEFVEPSATLLEKGKLVRNDVDEVGESEAKVEDGSRKPNDRLAKPVISKGDKVYACWSGDDGKVWYPGRVWSVKEHEGGEFGPVRFFDVVYDDGDTESNMEEIWVSKKEEYEMCLRKPEEEWVGVTNLTFPESGDDFARLVGWYRTTADEGVYSSLCEALRAHDKHTIDTRGRENVSAMELNFPDEYNL